MATDNKRNLLAAWSANNNNNDKDRSPNYCAQPSKSQQLMGVSPAEDR